MKSAIVPWHITDTFSFAAMDSAPPDHIAIVLWNTSDMILGTARSRTIESLLIKNLSLLGRTSEVSRARTSAQTDFSNDKARSNGDAPSRIAGPVRALAVVTGSAVRKTDRHGRDENRDLPVAHP